ncbi:hypothetical protein [Desulfosarcina sp.]|uniref:hypothetical protein n=1 Tax=Desulfosarcina sp. TaxID=2027861 RepID=UPI0039709FB2
MSRLAILWVALAFLSHVAEGSPLVRADDARPDAVSTPVAQASRGADRTPHAGSPAQKAYIDPDTGELIPRPDRVAPAERDSTQPPTLGASTDGMEERSSPVPDGGVMIDLKGRFQNPVSVTVDGKEAHRAMHPADDRTESSHAEP